MERKERQDVSGKRDEETEEQDSMRQEAEDLVRDLTPESQIRREAEAAGITLPKCPYCGEQPARVRSMPFQLNQIMTALTIYCGNKTCAKILGVQVMSVEQPRIATPQSGPMIVGNGNGRRN